MLEALKNSILNIFKKPLTIDFPLAEHPKAPYSRGLIEYSAEHCIFCNKCEKVCPPNAIAFFHNSDGTQKYDYNPYLCIYCGECVRACPKPDEAMWQSEKKPSFALKEDNVNTKWFEYQELCKTSKKEYAEAKKIKKQI